MSVNVIDTIKPKNGGSFPVVEAVDVKVSDSQRLDAALAAKANTSDLAALSTAIEGKADKTDIAGKADKTELIDIRTTLAAKAAQSSLDATNVVVAGKANQSSLDALSVIVSNKADKKDYSDIYEALDTKANKSYVDNAVSEAASQSAEADANLQTQIDQIEISASAEAVVAPEVIAARVGTDGETYSTLKHRLDAENSDVTSKLFDIATVGKQYLDKSAKVNGYYYISGGSLVIGGGSDWYLPAINVEAGKTYTLYDVYFPYVIFYDGDTYTAVSSDESTGSMHFTPNSNGQLYVTVSQWYINYAMVTDFDAIPVSDTSNLVKLSEDIKFNAGQIKTADVDFMQSNYQFLKKSEAVAGKYYYRNAEITADNATYYVFDGFEVQGGTTYTYVNIDAYHSMFYDYTNASWSALSENGTTALFTGTFTPTHNGKVYITVKDRAFSSAMFCNGDVPEKPVDGYYNTSIANNKISVEDTDFATCNHQLISVQGAIQGKFYNRTDVATASAPNRYALMPFKVKGGITYNFSNIDAYYTNVLDLVSGTYTPLSDDSEAGASASGTFTPTHDSLVFVTIHERDYQGGMFCDGAVPSAYIEGAYNIVLNGDTEKVNNVIVVDVNGGGDYTSLRTAFASITAPTTVYVRNGTYNVRSYYTNDEWEAENFVGLFVPDNVTLIGESRDGVIITATDSSAEVKQLISTLNIANNATLKNLTVKAEHIRYAVHDDWASAGQNEYTRIVENCVFEGTDLRYYTVYGAGVKQGANWSVRNCKFITHDGYRGFSCHNNLNWDKSSKISMVNNRFEGNSVGYGLSFGSLNSNNSGGTLYVELYGNKLENDTDKILLNEETGLGPGIKIYLTGFGNNFNNDNVDIRSSDGQDYSDHVDLF